MTGAALFGPGIAANKRRSQKGRRAFLGAPHNR
jgi:hypothetical protein